MPIFFYVVYGIEFLVISGCIVTTAVFLARHGRGGYGLALGGFIALLLQTVLGAIRGLLPLWLAPTMPLSRLSAVMGVMGALGAALQVTGLLLLLAALVSLRPAPDTDGSAHRDSAVQRNQ